MKIINWGILGTGKIAQKFAQDLFVVSNAKLKAIGSRSFESASVFAKKFNIDNIHSSYEALAKDPSVDIIYVATPHNLHKENTILCLKEGKAVLCEKPIGVNEAELIEMAALAKEKNIFLMEALWSYFLPSINKAKEWVQEGLIGELQHIKADFGFKAPYDPSGRLFNPELAGGALLDVGIYPLAFALLFAKADVRDIQVNSVMSRTGVDLTDTYQITFKNSIIADLSCSLGHSFQNDGYIYGTKGYIKLPLFWKGNDATLHSYNKDEIQSFTDGRTTHGYNYEAQEATDLLLQGKLESEILPHKTSLQLLNIMDNIRALIPLKYPFER